MSIAERRMTRSALDLARTAVRVAQEAIPAYSHRNSPKTFTQHQLFALVVLKRFFDTDFRTLEQLLADWSDLREALDLKKVPDHSTIHKAEERLLKKGALRTFSRRLSPSRKSSGFSSRHRLLQLIPPALRQGIPADITS